MMSDKADLKSTTSSFSRGMSLNNKLPQASKRPASAYNVKLGSEFQKLHLVKSQADVVMEESMSKDD